MRALLHYHRQMKTFSFIGSDKNAGKTTSFNFVVSHLKKTPLCLTSIGINGEFFDSLENHAKPTIIIPKDAYFVTTVDQLKAHPGAYAIVDFLHPPKFSKHFVLAQALDSRTFILEGPNQKSEILELKACLKKHFQTITLLIDGSIDRQFLGHPSVSDGFYFSLLISGRKEQREKAKDLIAPLRFPIIEEATKKLILKTKKEETRSLLFYQGELIHEGNEIPSLDKDLEQKLKTPIPEGSPKKILYLNGALNKMLYKELAHRKDLSLVLDNFTLYQNISSEQNKLGVFLPEITLFYPLNLCAVFLKEDLSRNNLFDFPSHIPVYNLHREIPYEIAT